MNFEKEIQEWVTIDNQIKLLNDKISALRERKNNLSQNLTTYADKNNLSNATIQISDGKLKFVNTRIIAPLTFKYLEKSLDEIIKNSGQVKQIVDYLKQHRESKNVPEIKRITKL